MVNGEDDISEKREISRKQSGGVKKGGLMSDFAQIFPKNGVKRGCFGAKAGWSGVGEGGGFEAQKGKFE